MSNALHPTTSETESLHVLIVEDQTTTAEMLGSYFEAEGYRVDTALWGEDALSLVEETVPDLIVLDIHLPDIDGYEICRYLRAHERTKHIPIIFLTQRRDITARLRGLQLGAVDYITKPFDIQELRLRVRNAVDHSHTQNPNHRITGLPVAALVNERLRQLVGHSGWAALSLRLEGLNEFSQRYGFVARDDVVRSAAAIVTHVRDDLAPSAFIGHLNAVDLLIIMKPEQVDPVKEALLIRLNQAVSFFHPQADNEPELLGSSLTVSMSELGPVGEPPSSLDEVRALLEAQRKQPSLAT